MDTVKIPTFDTHMSLLDKKAVDGNIYRKIGFFISSCLFFLVNSVMLFFRFMTRLVFRIKTSDGSHRDDSTIVESREFKQVRKSDKKGEDFMDENIERRMPTFSFKYQSQIFDEKIRRIEEEEKVDEKGTVVTSEKEDQPCVTAADIHTYRFLLEKDFSGFMDQPENMTFRVHEAFMDFGEENFDEENTDMRFLFAEDFLNPPMESVFDEGSNSNDYKFLSSSYKQGTKEDFIDLKYRLFEEQKSSSFSSETNSMGEREIRFISDDFTGFDFESDTDSSSDGYSVKELIYDSDIDDFLSERDFGEQENELENRETSMNTFNKLEQGKHEPFLLERSDDDDSDYDDDDGDHDHDHDYPNHVEVEEDISAEKLPSTVEIEVSMKSNSKETFAENELIETPEEAKLGLQSCEIFLMETRKSSDVESPNANALQIEFIEDSSDDELSSVKNGNVRLDSFGEVHIVKDLAGSEPKVEVLDREEGGNVADDRSNYDLINSVNVSEESEQNTENCDACKGSEVVRKKAEETKIDFDSEELDELWEHQDLIEQLKMELKKVRAVGLPTILEESESPRTIEDLKPFRIDEKFLREDPLDELQKFYKSYMERMRKFDILNYQKMYAMGFLQLRNPLHSMGTQRHLFSTIMSHLSQNLLQFCQKKSVNDPSENLIKDLQCDLETVYVGQTCLTWEILRWQYEKSRELSESDSHRRHQYNKVAGEFQQFQVLVQRFTENEQFQGPRLPNYVKQRCVLRNLLQVPIMKEDNLKDNMEKESDYVITSEMLEDIIGEAIRVFWEFVKAEKHDTPILIKVLVENNVELQNPSDYDFMGEILSNLQKKKKKLNDLLRTGNCIVKKFKKPQEDRSNQDLFFSQVDLKLVSRVLKMSRITSDQLIWCHKKQSKITFSERKVHREPSFLLFPC